MPTHSAAGKVEVGGIKPIGRANQSKYAREDGVPWMSELMPRLLRKRLTKSRARQGRAAHDSTKSSLRTTFIIRDGATLHVAYRAVDNGDEALYFARPVRMCPALCSPAGLDLERTATSIPPQNPSSSSSRKSPDRGTFQSPRYQIGRILIPES
jgi:hypothetical protein